MTGKIIQTSGKRKRAIARATIKEGKGIIRINGFLLDSFENKFFKMRIKEPLILAGEDAWKGSNMYIRVRGGGISGQAEAVRMAIARGLVEWHQDQALMDKFIDYDRTMLAGDIRRNWPKHFGGRKARAKFQKSYR